MVASVRSGERAAFAVLVRRYSPIAHRTAVLLGAGADADDVVQEAFVKAYRALGGLRDGAPVRPWLLRIVANETKNLHRSAGRRMLREQRADGLSGTPATPGTVDPADLAIGREEQEYLRGELLNLPGPQRLVVICRYLLDLDEAETAAVLGVARGTVKSRSHRALDRLRTALAADPHRSGAGVDHG